MKIHNYQGWYTSKPLSILISEYRENLTPFTKNKNYRECLQSLANQLTNLSFASRGHGLDLREDFYAYIYLDTRHPVEYEGQYRYVLPSGKVVNFSHRPMYAGKGTGDRMYAHLYETAGQGKNKYKHGILNKLKELGIEPKIIFTDYLVDEATAFAFEIDLIAGIGRYDLKLGPLTNMTDGGDGSPHLSEAVKNRSIKRRKKTMAAKSSSEKRATIRKWKRTYHSRSDAEKNQASAKMSARAAARTSEDRELQLQRTKDTYAAKSEEELRATNLKKSESRKAYLESLTEEERELLTQNSTEGLYTWLESLTDEEKAQHYATIVETREARPEEEKTATNKQRVESFKETWSKRTDEENEEWRNKIKETKNSKPAEERKRQAEKGAQTRADRSDEEKEEQYEKARQTYKKTLEATPDSVKQERVQKRLDTIANDPGSQERRNAKHKATLAAKSQEEKDAIVAKQIATRARNKALKLKQAAK